MVSVRMMAPFREHLRLAIFHVPHLTYRYRYMVSPWQSNGNSMEYVRRMDRAVDYRQMVMPKLCDRSAFSEYFPV